MKKISIEKFRALRLNYYYIIGSICIVAIGIVLLFTITTHQEQILVKRGIIENTEITTGYVIKNEKTIEKDTDKVIIPIISEGSRVAKNAIIATYKSSVYEDYEEELAKLDSDILLAMQDLPPMYSSEVDAIDSIIYSLVKESAEETSYNKMQEYKQKINGYVNKRATIIGDLSPEGATIKKLIKKRNNYEKGAKNSNDNILAPMMGLVSYKTDGLEDTFKYNNIDNITYNAIREALLNNKTATNNKIKVVNNYSAYIIVRSNKKYLNNMAQGSTYRMRLIEDNNYEFRVNLLKIVEDEDFVEVYFEVTNGIEELVNIRQAELEIVWQWEEGLYVPLNSLNKYNGKDINYITTIKYANTVDIPVRTGTRNEKYVIVSNYEEEKSKELGLDKEYNLALHDRVVINAK